MELARSLFGANDMAWRNKYSVLIRTLWFQEQFYRTFKELYHFPQCVCVCVFNTWICCAARIRPVGDGSMATVITKPFVSP